MVIVTMTEYHRIYCGQIYAENFRILHNCVGLPCIK